MKRYLILFLAFVPAGCGKEAVYQDKSVSEWRQALQADDAALRLEAATALWKLGREAKEAAPDLAATLQQDKDARVRAKAAEALWSMGDCAKDAVPALIEALKDKNVDVRINAAGALGDMGPAGQAAIPNLIDALEDKHPDVITTIAKAFGRMGGDAREAVPALSEFLKDSKLNPLFKDSKRSAAEERNERAKIKIEVADALTLIGPDAQEAIPALTELAKERDKDVHAAAKRALAAIEAKR